MLASLNEGNVYGNLTPDGWINLTNDEITAAWLKGTGNFNVDWQGVRAVLWALQMKTLEQQRNKQND
jgi:hypothetical protein